MSVDPDTTLASWARDAEFPILFASDTGGAAMDRYGVFNTSRRLDTRALFVIAPDGRIAYRTPSFVRFLESGKKPWTAHSTNCSVSFWCRSPESLSRKPVTGALS